MNTLQHLDYQGSVTFEDGRLVIQILHIDDTITTECDRASEAPGAFAELVVDYLETCRAVGKEPSKPFKGTFNVRLGPALHRKAAVAAAERDESLNSWIAGAVEQRLGRDQILRDLRAGSVLHALMSRRAQTAGVYYQTERDVQRLHISDDEMPVREVRGVGRFFAPLAGESLWRPSH